jgi:hypothetical protein
MVLKLTPSSPRGIDPVHHDRHGAPSFTDHRASVLD